MHAIGIYVDDFPIASNSTKCMQQVTNKLKEKSPVKDLGPMEHFLGMKVTWNRIKGTLSLSQKKLVEEILQKFEMVQIANLSPRQ